MEHSLAAVCRMNHLCPTFLFCFSRRSLLDSEITRSGVGLPPICCRVHLFGITDERC